MTGALMKSAGLLPVVALLLSASGGCRYLSDPGPTGPEITPGPAPAGSVRANVVLIDARGMRPLDKSNVVITLEGTAFTCTTDTYGRWGLFNVPAGTYAVVGTKEGFGYSRTVGFHQIGGEKAQGPKVFIQEIPRFVVTDLRDSAAAGQMSLVGNISGFFSTRNYVRLFVGLDSTVSSNPNFYRTSVQLWVEEENPDQYADQDASGAGTRPFTASVDPGTISDDRLVRGTLVYGRAYADGPMHQSYPDSSTGRPIFTSINPNGSNIIRFTLP